ncbi:hypothetical protein B0H14DRAFT_3433131 [Mycena olivaceomarginata]|nr:hypothetical protein B0H14DRAFT_3433131 [Mycena olivaceomarginata]
MLNGDIVMSEELDIFLDSPKSYKPAARGWTKELVRANHKDEVIELLNANPDTCVAVVILASDFFDCDRGGAIKSIFMSRKLPDADKIDVYPPTKEHVTSGKGMSMPWTNIISDCSRAFKEAALADPVFHDVHPELPISFYCIDVVPEMPWIVAVFDGLHAPKWHSESHASQWHFKHY